MGEFQRDPHEMTTPFDNWHTGWSLIGEARRSWMLMDDCLKGGHNYPSGNLQPSHRDYLPPLSAYPFSQSVASGPWSKLDSFTTKLDGE